MRLPYVGVVLLPSLLAGCSEHAGSPLAPTPENRLQGTYTLTAATSPSCEFQGSWMFRADITQSGRDLQVKLWRYNGNSLCDSETYEMCQPSFHGQDNPDGVLFFFIARHSSRKPAVSPGTALNPAFSTAEIR